MPLLCESPQPQKVHRKILGFAWVGWIFDFYDLLLLSYLVTSTTLRQDLGLSRDQVALLLGSALGFSAVGGLLCGALADRYGRRPLLMATILIYSAGTFLSGLCTGMWTLFAARAVTGLGVGGEWAVAHALVGETVPPHVRGRYGSYLQSGAVFGRFLATVVGFSLAPWIGWRTSFMLSALPALMAVVIRRQMPESDLWQRDRAAMRTRGFGQPLYALGRMLGPELRKVTALALLVTLFNMAAYWLKTSWLPTYFHEVRGLSGAEASRLFFVEQLGSLAGYVLFGFMSDRYGRRPTFSLFCLIKAVSLTIVTLGWRAARGSAPVLFGCMLLVGFGEGNWGGIGPLLNELFPTAIRGAAIGIVYNVARGAQFLAPLAVALVASRATFAEGIALAAAFALLAGASVWTLPETKGVALDGRVGASPLSVRSKSASASPGGSS
jgi:MFS family permease